MWNLHLFINLLFNLSDFLFQTYISTDYEKIN